jgi:hypothetical protein
LPLDFSFTLFIDENHCRNKALLEGLSAAGIVFEKHCDYFDRGTNDVIWIPYAGLRGWVVVTTDDNIRRRAIEKRKVLTRKVRLFVFTNNNTFGAVMAQLLITAMPEMKALIDRQAPPLMASITRQGHVVPLWPKVK